LPYEIRYTPEAETHLRGLTARQQATLLDMVEKQLLHQPTVRTRNRKLMRDNPLAQWELRIGDLRVYYAVKDEPEPTVVIRAIGIKVRDRVYIQNEEVDL
jgi:mRNA-degrading endonuclease RelE of RelBE toxin-antitoxin system